MAIGTPVTLGSATIGGTPTTLTLTTAAAVTAGDSIVVAIYIPSATTTLSSVTDSAGNTYAIDIQYKHTGQPRRVCLASCHNATALASGGTITATMSAATSGSKGISALTCSGLQTSSTLDKTASDEGSSTTWATGSTGTLTQADELAVGFAASVSGTASTTTSPWVELEDFSSQRNVLVYQVVSATTALNAGGTWGNAVWVGVISTYKGATTNVTVTASTAEATASGDDVVVRAGNTVTGDPAAATASGDPVGLNITIPADPAAATASGDDVTVVIPCTVVADAGVATASGDPVTIAAADLTIPGVTAAATASGDDVVIRIAVDVAVVSGEATASGDTVTIVAPLTVVASSATATASGGTVVPTYARTVTVTGGTATGSGNPVSPTIVGPPVGGGSGEGYGEETLPDIGLIPARRSRPGQFRIKLTSLHYPFNTTTGASARTPVTLAHIHEFSAAEVQIPANDSRTASVTISLDDEDVLAQVNPYRTLLHIVYVTPNSARLVFWGIVNVVSDSSEQNTVTLNAVDMSYRMQHHYLRFGDRILNAFDDATLPNSRGRGYVAYDSEGLRWLRDAADNTEAQSNRGVPVLGIMDGSLTDPFAFDTEAKVEVRRGDNIWQTWLSNTGQDAAPDFELEPVDNQWGYYAKLHTYLRQGSDNPALLLFTDGDNCRLDFTTGGKLVTHNHTLSSGEENRKTVVDTDSSAENGVYVQWDVTEYASFYDTPLLARGTQVIREYGEPRDYFDVRLDDDANLYYLEDFIVGDACRAVRRRGTYVKRVDGHITMVTLRQVDAAGNVLPEIEAAVVGGEGVATEDDS